MRAAMIACVVCAIGCRQLLGIDTPGRGVVDAPEDSAPLDSTIDGPPAVTHFVQGSGAQATKSATASFPEAAVGDLLVVGASWSQPTAVMVTDEAGDSFAQLAEVTNATGDTLVVYYATSGISQTGLTSVTVTLTDSEPIELVVAQYHGISTTTVVDGEIGASGNGTSAQTPTLATLNASDVLVAIGASTTKLTADPPFTSRVQSPAGLDVLEDLDVTQTGSYRATETTGGGVWLIELAALRAAP